MNCLITFAQKKKLIANIKSNDKINVSVYYISIKITVNIKVTLIMIADKESKLES